VILLFLGKNIKYDSAIFHSQNNTSNSNMKQQYLFPAWKIHNGHIGQSFLSMD